MSGGGAACSAYKSTGEGAAPVGAGLRGEELSMEDVGPSKMGRKIEIKASLYQNSFKFIQF